MVARRGGERRVGGGGGWVFFFKQKTAYEVGTGDWSSDVCSSDLHSYFLLCDQLCPVIDDLAFCHYPDRNVSQVSSVF